MDYIISNDIVKRQILASISKKEGRVIYEGHKLGMPDELLPIIVRHHHERYSSSFLFFDYEKWNSIYGMQQISPTMTDCWFKKTENSKGLLESYNTLLNLMEEKFGKFKNIYIVEN